MLLTAATVQLPKTLRYNHIRHIFRSKPDSFGSSALQGQNQDVPFLFL